MTLDEKNLSEQGEGLVSVAMMCMRVEFLRRNETSCREADYSRGKVHQTKEKER